MSERSDDEKKTDDKVQLSFVRFFNEFDETRMEVTECPDCIKMEYCEENGETCQGCTQCVVCSTCSFSAIAKKRYKQAFYDEIEMNIKLKILFIKKIINEINSEITDNFDIIMKYDKKYKYLLFKNLYYFEDLCDYEWDLLLRCKMKIIFLQKRLKRAEKILVQMEKNLKKK